MRELTFRGYLEDYVKQLSEQNTTGIYKLLRETEAGNLRLKEPVFLYALFSGKTDLLLRAAKGTQLEKHYLEMTCCYTEETMQRALCNDADCLSWEYRKVWKSYQSRKNHLQTDQFTKELMRKKLKRLQEQKKVSNYRIYTDLKLNPGNFNAWMKHGTGEKVSLQTARAALNYLQNQ